jgi:hypothetical protein
MRIIDYKEKQTGHISATSTLSLTELFFTVVCILLRISLLLNYVYRLRTLLLFIILFFTLHVSTSAGHLHVFYIYHTISALCVHSLLLVPSCH